MFELCHWFQLLGDMATPHSISIFQSKYIKTTPTHIVYNIKCNEQSTKHIFSSREREEWFLFSYLQNRDVFWYFFSPNAYEIRPTLTQFQEPQSASFDVFELHDLASNFEALKL